MNPNSNPNGEFLTRDQACQLGTVCKYRSGFRGGLRHTTRGSGTIALGPSLTPLVGDALENNTFLPLDAVVTVGGRRYTVSEVIIDRESSTKNFKLVISPANEAAKLGELAAGPGRSISRRPVVECHCETGATSNGDP